jgi:hypothetical protein
MSSDLTTTAAPTVSDQHQPVESIAAALRQEHARVCSLQRNGSSRYWQPLSIIISDGAVKLHATTVNASSALPIQRV